MVSRYVDEMINIAALRCSRFISNSEYGKLQEEINLVREVFLTGGSVVVLIVLLLGKSLLELFGDYQGRDISFVLLSVGGGLLNPTDGPVEQILLMSKKGKVIILTSVIALRFALLKQIVGQVKLSP